jgi:predicted SAM-dependent methyltransferase
MSYPTHFRLPLDENKRYIEFGGGANPRVRPGKDVRVDVRPCQLGDGGPAVDFCADFDKPFTEEYGQAIASGEFDGAVCIYALEHLSWRKVPQFLSEMRRVLKPGGTVFLMVPNTQAQMEHLLKTEDWNDAGSMLFGGQDYPENTHKAAFTPALITKLLTDAGFVDVAVQKFGIKGTDMAVQAVAGGTNPGMPMQEQSHDTPTLAGFPVVKSPEVRAFRSLGTPEEPITLIDFPRPPYRFAGRAVDGTMFDADTPEELSRVIADHDGKTVNQARSDAGVPPLVGPEGDRPAVPGSLRDTPTVSTPEGLWKSEPSALQVQCYHRFTRQYFDGGLPQGGGYQMYWDFPCHELTARHVLERKPESVLELGCARGYVVKRLQDAGVIACGWDFSPHCHLTRAAESVVLADATDRGRWGLVKDQAFDMAFSIAFLDHVPEDLLPVVIEGMAAKCRRGLHGINFDQSPGGDSTRLTRRPKEWWQSVLPQGHEVVDKSELEAGWLPDKFYQGDGKVKLNLGSFATMFHHGWTNIDVHDLRQFAEQWRYNYKVWDCRNGLPYATKSVDLIYHTHFLEHLSYEEGQEVLNECRRVLKPGGAMRVIVPDVDALIGSYSKATLVEPTQRQNRGMNHFDPLSGSVERRKTPAGKLYAMLCHEHKALYDAETLIHMLEQAGFGARQSGFRNINAGGRGTTCRHDGLRQILVETNDVLPDLSLFVDAVPRPL